MPYKDKETRRKASREKSKLWLKDGKCVHCGQKLPLNYELKNCEKCVRKRKEWGWNQKLNAMCIISNSDTPKCVNCDIVDLRLLTINHINGQGRKERTCNKERGGYKFYQSIISGERETTDLNIMCYNHNILYEYERGKRLDLTDTLI